MLLDLYSFTFVTRQIRLGLSWWLSGAAHSVCFAWTVTGMGLGAYPRSGWIIYVKIISVCFEINFLDRREGWMVSSIIYEQWWHLCHQAGSPLKQCQSKTNSCCQWRPHKRLWGGDHQGHSDPCSVHTSWHIWATMIVWIMKRRLSEVLGAVLCDHICAQLCAHSCYR